MGIYSLTILKPEVRNQRTSRAVLFLQAPGRNPFLHLPVSNNCQHPLACGCLSLWSIFPSPSLCVRVFYILPQIPLHPAFIRIHVTALRAPTLSKGIHDKLMPLDILNIIKPFAT